MGWRIDARTITCVEKEFPLSRSWSLLRASLIIELKRASWANLATRRPKLYDGLGMVDTNLHSKLLKSLPTYSAVILCRVWGGCPMTKAHRATLDKTVDPGCECGAACQDVPHLLFHCPLCPPASPLVLSLLPFPPALSAALLLSPAQRNLKDAWEAACVRICNILGRKEDLRPEVVVRDLKNHVPVLERSSKYFSVLDVTSPDVPVTTNSYC